MDLLLIVASILLLSGLNALPHQEVQNEIIELPGGTFASYLTEEEKRLDSSITAFPEFMKDIKAKDICAGGYRTAVLTESGSVLEWGVGTGSTSSGREVIFESARGESKPNIVAIACGDYHTLALSDQGELFSWGRDSVSLGHENAEGSDPNVAAPVGGALSSKKVVAAAAGFEHNVAVTDDGKVYAWGSSEYGQTGSESKSSALPTKINTMNKPIAQVCCGGHHTVLLTGKGQVLALGSGSFGKLGNNDVANSKVATLVENLADKNITQIACGGDHSLALSSDGKLYAWGWNEHGQIGSSDFDDRTTPHEISVVEAIDTIHVGRYANSAYLSDGEVSACGWNEGAHLGTGNTDAVPNFTKIFGLDSVKKLAIGYKHLLALKSDGSVGVLGDGVYGQLGETVEAPSHSATPTENIHNAQFSQGNDSTAWIYALSEEQNTREYMEDVSFVSAPFANNESLGLFAIFDGHGGKLVSEFAAGHLPQLVLRELFEGKSKEEAFKQAYLSLDHQISSLFPRKDRDMTGSTAVTVLVERNTEDKKALISCANIGDSRAILSANEQTVRLSYDHKASDEAEVSRIVSSGGKVFRKRVRGMLAVTRAFGDTLFDKHNEVLAEPFFFETPVDTSDAYLIIGSDGLWDVFSDEEVSEKVRTRAAAGQALQTISDSILQEAIDAGSTDNISILIARL